jgi:uncharacterized protein
VKNYWGGKSNATTHLLGEMHYQGWLRVARREAGIRLYTVHQHEAGPTDADARRARIDALVDAVVHVYAPMPLASMRDLVLRLRYAVPHWEKHLTGALQRARERFSHAMIDGIDWYWPADEDPKCAAPPDAVRLLAPFDPVVWDRDRFELLWGWVYRFEAYTPPGKRIRGYYAQPLLWRDRVIGWGNVSVKDGDLNAEFGYVDSGPTADRVFKRELEEELERVRVFLGLRS